MLLRNSRSAKGLIKWRLLKRDLLKTLTSSICHTKTLGETKIKSNNIIMQLLDGLNKTLVVAPATHEIGISWGIYIYIYIEGIWLPQVRSVYFAPSVHHWIADSPRTCILTYAMTSNDLTSFWKMSFFTCCNLKP